MQIRILFRAPLPDLPFAIPSRPAAAGPNGCGCALVLVRVIRVCEDGLSVSCKDRTYHKGMTNDDEHDAFARSPCGEVRRRVDVSM